MELLDEDDEETAHEEDQQLKHIKVAEVPECLKLIESEAESLNYGVSDEDDEEKDENEKKEEKDIFKP